MTRLLVTGSRGQVGHELAHALAPLGTVIALDRDGLDLASADAIRRAVRDARPDIILNAAAYTAVDRAETEPDVAMKINGEAPGILAGEAGRAGALIVHYSTDYVFDGTKDGPYVEDDRPHPLGAYGRSKLAGEEAIRASGARHLIFRTSWVYAARGNNFVRTMLRLARERGELRIVDDQVGAPTWARTIAGATARILQALAGPGRELPDGTFHLAAAGAVSWFGFAQAIFAAAKARDPKFKVPLLTPIPASQYPTAARRPANSRLDTTRLSTTFGIALPHWKDELQRCLAEMEPGG